MNNNFEDLLKDILKYRALISALNQEEGWKKIVDKLRKKYRIHNLNIILNYSDHQTGGEKLLIEFQSRCWPLEFLIILLREVHMYDAVAIFETEPMKITKQPNEGLAGNIRLFYLGDEFTLECLVDGIPRPAFKWYKDDMLLTDQNSSKLFYKKFRQDLIGKYYCKATQLTNQLSTVKSESVVVDICPIPCVIQRAPLPYIYRREGESLKFEIIASGYPAPQFQWTYENEVCENENSNIFLIERCSKSNSGLYRCMVYNKVNTGIIEIRLTVTALNFVFKVVKDPVIEKVALLIGNKYYKNHDELVTPENDVDALKRILQNKGFLVIKKKNLQLAEMKAAIHELCNMAVEGAYILMYFGGHGFELKEKYLVPIDAPHETEYHTSHCINQCQILQDVLKTKPRLFILMLDMCLTLPDRSKNESIFDEGTIVYDYTPDSNLIISYSTTSRLTAREITEENCQHSNSCYVTALSKYMEQNLPIFEMIVETNKSVRERYEQLIKQIRHDLEQYKNLDTLDETSKKKQMELENNLESIIQFKQIPSLCLNVTEDYDLNVPTIGHPRTREMYRRMISK